MMPVGPTALGRQATEISVTRRGAAVAGKLPVVPLRRLTFESKRLKSGAPSCGLQTCDARLRPENTRLAVGRSNLPWRVTKASEADLRRGGRGE